MICFQSGFSFHLSELGLSERPGSLPSIPRVSLPPPPPPPHLVALVEAVGSLEGVVSVVLFDSRSGQQVLCRGQAPDGDVLRRLACFFVLDDDPLEESLLVSRSHHHLVRRLDAGLCLHMILDRTRGPAIGLTRVLVEQRIGEALRQA